MPPSHFTVTLLVATSKFCLANAKYSTTLHLSINDNNPPIATIYPMAAYASPLRAGRRVVNPYRTDPFHNSGFGFDVDRGFPEFDVVSNCFPGLLIATGVLERGE